MTSTAITDPAHFSAYWLRSELWRRQRDIQRAIARKPLVAVKACHASGKTYLAARLALWWISRYSDGLCINTAPTMRQVKVMWGEIRQARSNARARFPEPAAVELRISDNNYIQGISTNEAVKFQSIHGRHVLIIADEAPGIKADIWGAIEGIRAGGDVRVLMLGNPVVPSGHYFDAFGRGRSIWDTYSISALDTPNLAGVDIAQLLAMSEDELSVSPMPWLITRRWVRERAIMWGPDHPMFKARVLGQFPSQGEHSVFSLEMVEGAKRDASAIEKEKAARLRVQVGIDVAGPGEDETTMVTRAGGEILEQLAWSKPDPRGDVVRELAKWRHRLDAVVCDIDGIGYNFALHLADQRFPVYGFRAGQKPRDQERFYNVKAEAYWTLREWMQAGAICGLNDLECEAQLSGIQYSINSRGQTEIESKDEARKRGVSSPDRAEALIMAFTLVVPRQQTMVSGGDYQISPI